jgi:hypothetical protein
MGFGFMIRSIGLFDIHYLTHIHPLVAIVMSSLAIAQYQLPLVDVPLPLGSPVIPDLSYQLLTATAHDRPTLSITNQLTQLN